MLTFEQVRPAMHKWAGYFQNNFFDHWELINEVWLRGRVQQLDEIRFASNRIRCDMIDYIRDTVRSRRKYQPKSINFNTLAGMGDEKEKEYRISSFLSSMQKQQGLDTRDYFDWLTRGLSRTEKLIVKLRHLEGFTFDEMGIVVGVAESRISQIYTNTLKILRRRLIDANERPRLYQGQTETEAVREKAAAYHRGYYRRNTEKKRFYNNMYYDINKKHIQGRRKQLREARKSA